MENANSYEYLEKIKIAVIENLKKTAPVPSVQMQDVPRQGLGMTDEEEAELDDLDADENKDVRMTQRQWEKSVARHEEFDESDDEEMAHANGLNYDGPPRRSIMDYRNPHADYDVDSRVPTPSGRATPSRNELDEAAAGEANEPEEVKMEDAAPAPSAEDDGPPPVEAKVEVVDDDGDVNMDDSTANVDAEETTLEGSETKPSAPAVEEAEAEMATVNNDEPKQNASSADADGDGTPAKASDLVEVAAS